MDTDKINQLKEFLDTAEDWEKMKVIDGVFIVKMPATQKFQAKLGVEILPVGKDGKPLKKKGLYILHKEMLEAYRSVFNSEKLGDLLDGISSVNSDTKPKESKKEGKVTGVFEL